jgi:hypothetical protein
LWFLDDDVARTQMSAPLLRTTFVALARYFPVLSCTCVRKDPDAFVVAVSTVLQWPDLDRWIFTGTLATHAENPPALTCPDAIRCLLRPSDTVREWSTLTT